MEPIGPETPTPARRTSSLGYDIFRGAIGFCLVSIAGFAPWAFWGRALTKSVGEAGMYVVCAVVFIGLAGVVLHPLVARIVSLGRFYKIFSIAFAAYSVAWIVFWMLIRGHLGGVVGLFVGTALMGWIMTRGFKASDALIPVIVVLFVTNAAGYFVGGWVEGWLAHDKGLFGEGVSRATQMRTAMLSWGVCYGLGLGAGLGFALHRCS